MLNSEEFARALSINFREESRIVKFDEVEQFRALIKSFRNVAGHSTSFEVEEYHGPKHQVYFTGEGAWARDPARCELCDVMILTYSLAGGFRSRLTFLQAKLSKDNQLDLCQNHPYLSTKVDFKANLEQWDLLSRRPEIEPVLPFKVHPLLLKDSLLASVGTYGVFHKSNGEPIDFFYASADVLSVKGSPITRDGRLINTEMARQRIVNGILETTFCCCIYTFAEALYNLEIGTPLELSTTRDGGQNQSATLIAWVKSALQHFIQFGEGESGLARQMLRLLPEIEDESIDFGSEFPSLILIRTDSKENDNFMNDRG